MKKTQKILIVITFIVSLVCLFVLFEKLGFKTYEEYEETFAINKYQEIDGSFTGIGYYSIFLAAFLSFKVYRLFEDKKNFKIIKYNYYWTFWLLFLTINEITTILLKRMNFEHYIFWTLSTLIFLITSYIFYRVHRKKQIIFDKIKTTQ